MHPHLTMRWEDDHANPRTSEREAATRSRSAAKTTLHRKSQSCGESQIYRESPFTREAAIRNIGDRWPKGQAHIGETHINEAHMEEIDPWRDTSRKQRTVATALPTPLSAPLQINVARAVLHGRTVFTRDNRRTGGNVSRETPFQSHREP